MHKQLIERPIILAICGKSASGKDTLAKWLTNYLSSFGLYIHNMTSYTTRSPREKEKDGEDYYFINEAQFNKLIEQKKLIEHTHFRGWCYGVSYNEVKSGYINIGVFNLEGLRSLEKDKYKYMIIPIYLNENLKVRLRRSHDREGKWRLEYFRRAIADEIEFKDVKQKLSHFHGRYIYLDKIEGVWKQSQLITKRLIKWGILVQDKKTKEVQLGNFV